MRALLVITGAVIGIIIGYYVVVIPSCDWFWPDSNLCGVYFPIGSFIGALIGAALGSKLTVKLQSRNK